MNLDITFCVNGHCRNTLCERHPDKLRLVPAGSYVSIADFGGVCREYIADVLEEIENERDAGNACESENKK